MHYLNCVLKSLKALEEARAEKVIGKSLEAKLLLALPKKLKENIESKISKVAQWLTVSQCDLSEGEFSVKVEKASGTTCPRCWNVVEHTHTEDGLCDRCAEGIKIRHTSAFFVILKPC